MIRRAWILLAALALTAGAACSAPGHASIHPTLAAALKLQYTPGETITYAVTVNSNLLVAVPSAGMQPVNSDLKALETLKVLSVDPDGTATIQATVTGLTGTANGQPITSSPKVPPITLKIASDGRIVSAGSATPGSIASIPGGDQITPLLPAGKVKPGDRWTRDYTRPNPFGSGTLNVHTANEFLRYETLGGTKYAVVSTTAHVPLNLSIDLAQLASLFGMSGSQTPSGTASYTGTVDPTLTSWLDPKTGALYEVKNSSKLDVTMDIPGNVAGSIHMTGTISLNLVRQ